MTRPQSLSEAWDAHQADEPITAPSAIARGIRDKRQWHAGAQAALLLMMAGRSPDVLMAEVIAYGKTIGTAAERA